MAHLVHSLMEEIQDYRLERLRILPLLLLQESQPDEVVDFRWCRDNQTASGMIYALHTMTSIHSALDAVSTFDFFDFYCQRPRFWRQLVHQFGPHILLPPAPNGTAQK